MSVSTCGDLQSLSLGALQKEFGPKTGQSLYKYCRGQDDRQIKLEQERKSVSAEINYGIRFKNVSFFPFGQVAQSPNHGHNIVNSRWLSRTARPIKNH